jgi:acyl dehydratase
MPIARKVYYQSVQAGDEVPSFQAPPVDRMQIARYAGATGDFNPLYVDEPFSRSAGFRSVIVPGPVAFAALSQMITEWLKGPSLRRLHVRYLKLIWPGDVLTCRGRVTGRRREGSDYLIDIDLWIENQDGEMVTRGSGTATLFYSAQDEAQRLAGGPPILVDENGSASRDAEGRGKAQGGRGTAPAKRGSAKQRR